jgi:hypothetical protein
MIFANFFSDFGRQFDVRRLPSELTRQMLVWTSNLRGFVFLADLLEGSPAADLRRAARNGRLLEVSEATKAVFPTLVTPLVLRHRHVWFCWAMPTLTRAKGPARLTELLGSTALLRQRLLHWRRLAYAAKNFALAFDVFRSQSPVLVIVSDSIDSNRAFALAARQCGVPSLGTCHGVNMWASNLLAVIPLVDIHCAYSSTPPSLCHRSILAGAPTKRIVCHDANQFTKGSARAAEPDRATRILLITSGHFFFDGWLRSLSLKQREYADSLRTLVQIIGEKLPGVEVIIKSHPLSDEHDMYDRLARQFPSVVTRHWREPLASGQPIDVDAAVVYNCITGLFFAAVDQEIPVVAHWGALTSFGRRLLATTDLVGSEESKELGGLLAEILNAPDGPTALRARSHARMLYNRFLEPPRYALEEAISEVLPESKGELRGKCEAQVSYHR